MMWKIPSSLRGWLACAVMVVIFSFSWLPSLAQEAEGCKEGCGCQGSACGCNEGFCKTPADNECMACPCFAEPVIEHGVNLGKCLGTKSGKVCDVECEEGHVAHGSTVCLAGKWNPLARCTPKDKEGEL